MSRPTTILGEILCMQWCDSRFLNDSFAMNCIYFLAQWYWLSFCSSWRHWTNKIKANVTNSCSRTYTYTQWHIHDQHRWSKIIREKRKLYEHKFSLKLHTHTHTYKTIKLNSQFVSQIICKVNCNSWQKENNYHLHFTISCTKDEIHEW